MKFDRNAAIAYARQYWDRPCDDGVFWRTDYAVEVDKMRKVLGAPAKDGRHARFVSDGLGTEHAVFQREGGEARGEGNSTVGRTRRLRPLSEPMPDRRGVLNSRDFGAEVSRAPEEQTRSTVLAEQVTRERGQGIVDTGVLDKGDMLGYFNVDPRGDYGGRRQYSHSTMFVGKTKPQGNNIPTTTVGSKKYLCYDFEGCKAGYPVKVCTFDGPHTPSSVDDGTWRVWEGDWVTRTLSIPH